MCSRVRACLPGRPCPPCPALHVGKGRGMLGSAPGVFKEMLRGCSGDTQGMPRGMPRRVWSIQQPNTVLCSTGIIGLATAGSHRSSGFRQLRGGDGVAKRVPAPPGHTQSRGRGSALHCSSSSPALSRGDGTGDAHLHPPPAPSPAAGPASGMSHGEEQQPCWGWMLHPAGDGARGAGTPGSSGQRGGRAPLPREHSIPAKPGRHRCLVG